MYVRANSIVLTHYIGSQQGIYVLHILLIEIHYHIVLTHFSNLHLWGSFTAKWKVFFFFFKKCKVSFRNWMVIFEEAEGLLQRALRLCVHNFP